MMSRVVQGGQESMRSALLICDLDGTLIDSYSGIKAALQHALSVVGSQSAEQLDRWIVGPPLDELLRRALEGADPTKLAKAKQAFVEVYDHDTCKLAEPFPGVDEMLDQLLTGGIRLGLATNKRFAPTAAILESRGWHSMFKAVEAVDSRPGPPRRKADMLGEILRCGATCPSSSYYLGDSDADAVAAQEVRIPFILAAWGAIQQAGVGGALVASRPDAVVQYLKKAPRFHPSIG